MMIVRGSRFSLVLPGRQGSNIRVFCVDLDGYRQLKLTKKFGLDVLASSIERKTWRMRVLDIHGNFKDDMIIVTRTFQ